MKPLRSWVAWTLWFAVRGYWDTTFAVNVKSVFLCNRAAAPIFRKQNSGRIVNISSVAGRRPSDFLVAYATSKAAVIAFTQSMALLMAPHHVNVNCVCPGERPPLLET